MKRILTAIVMLSLLLAFTPVQGAIIWQGDYTLFDFNVSQNGGTFYYAGTPGSYNPSGQGLARATNGGPPGGAFTDVATGNLVEFGGPSSPPPGSIQMTGQAQGSSLADGLKVQAFAGTYPTSLTSDHGIDVNQTVISWIARRFIVDSAGTYALIADLTGLGGVDFDSFFNSSFYHASYTLNGEVTLEALTGGGSTSLGQVMPALLLNQGTQHVQTNVALSPVINEESVIYQLKTTLTLTTDIQNFRLENFSIPGILSGDYQLGSLDAPIQLTATVPIPGSALLLFSGLGGLSLLRFRRRKNG